MGKNLLLVTDGYPFNENDRPFLASEIEELNSKFNVCILANTDSKGKAYGFPKNISAWKFCYGRFNVFALLMQFKHKEVRADIAKAIKTLRGKEAFLNVCRILLYSLRGQQVRRQMREIVEEHEIDLIYTYWCTQATVGALRLKKEFPRLKVITRFHGADLYNERVQEGRQPMRYFIASNADQLMFVCNKGKEYFLEEWPGDWNEHCVVTYLGTKSMKRIPVARKPKLVIVSCSNLIPLKQVNLIIEAIALAPSQVRIEWNHLGDGPEREKLEELAQRKFGPMPCITWRFWGAIPHSEIEQVYQQIQPDLFITASSTEGLPVSVQEALSMGVPVIGTNVGGMEELICDGVNGFLLPANTSPKLIYEKIEQFQTLSLLERNMFSEMAREVWQKNFDAKKNAKKFVGILEEVSQ